MLGKYIFRHTILPKYYLLIESLQSQSVNKADSSSSTTYYSILLLCTGSRLDFDLVKLDCGDDDE